MTSQVIQMQERIVDFQATTATGLMVQAMLLAANIHEAEDDWCQELAGAMAKASRRMLFEQGADLDLLEAA